MCNAMSFRRSRDELIQFSNQLQLDLTGVVPEFRPRYRIGPKERHVIMRPTSAAAVRAEMAVWGLIPPNAKEPPKLLLTNARADKIASAWPWKLIHRRGRCLVPSDGFFEPEKPGRSKEKAPWSYYTMQDGSLFVMAGLFTEVADPGTGEVISTYAVITTTANSAIRIHDRMPVILDPEDARAWLWDEDFPDHLLKPYPADRMAGWRVSDEAKHFRKPDHPGMNEPVEEARLL